MEVKDYKKAWVTFLLFLISAGFGPMNGLLSPHSASKLQAIKTQARHHENHHTYTTGGL